MIAALFLGLASSVHCVGMCGPLHLAIPFRGPAFVRRLALHLGRVTTYIILGVLAGIIGSELHFAGLQNWLAIITGSLLILSALANYSPRIVSVEKFISKMNGALTKLFESGTVTRYFTFGLTNGLLPCGMVYFAMMSAANSDSISKAMMFMAFFGLGTTPLLLSVTWFGSAIGGKLLKLKWLNARTVAITLGTLLLLRGLELGIPLLSPEISSSPDHIQHCIEVTAGSCANPE